MNQAQAFELGRAVGVAQAGSGVFERRVGEWFVAVNPSAVPVRASRGAAPVPPLSAYVERNGEPVAVWAPDYCLGVVPVIEVVSVVKAAVAAV